MKKLKRMSEWQLGLIAMLVTVITFVVTMILVILLWMFGTGEPLLEWDLWSMLEGISGALSFAVVVGGGFFAVLQLVEATDSRHIEVFNDTFNRLMSDDEIRARRWIYQHLPPDPAQGIAGLSEIGQRHVKLVLNSFDHLGFLIQQDLIDDDSIIEWVSPIVVKTWKYLGPYVHYEARRRKEPYYYSTACKLAERCRDWWIANGRSEEFVWVDDAL